MQLMIIYQGKVHLLMSRSKRRVSSYIGKCIVDSYVCIDSFITSWNQTYYVLEDVNNHVLILVHKNKFCELLTKGDSYVR